MHMWQSCTRTQSSLPFARPVRHTRCAAQERLRYLDGGRSGGARPPAGAGHQPPGRAGSAWGAQPGLGCAGGGAEEEHLREPGALLAAALGAPTQPGPQRARTGSERLRLRVVCSRACSARCSPGCTPYTQRAACVQTVRCFCAATPRALQHAGRKGAYCVECAGHARPQGAPYLVLATQGCTMLCSRRPC